MLNILTTATSHVIMCKTRQFTLKSCRVYFLSHSFTMYFKKGHLKLSIIGLRVKCSYFFFFVDEKQTKNSRNKTKAALRENNKNILVSQYVNYISNHSRMGLEPTTPRKRIHHFKNFYHRVLNLLKNNFNHLEVRISMDD